MGLESASRSSAQLTLPSPFSPPSIGATVVTTGLFYWQDIKPFFVSLNPWNKTVRIIHDEHYTKMQVYKPIPRWLYAVIRES